MVPNNRRLAGSYELLEEIGAGGMGRVWRARHIADGSVVAVKVISIDDVDAGYERRFRREPEIQSGLGHRNIVRLIDWFRVSDRFLLVMEYVDGETLAARIGREGPLPVPVVLDLARQLLDAVGHLHELGILHRDIKPSNILVTRDGTLKLADFGIARYTWQQQGTLTRHGIGTPEYMSPEQTRGEAIDERSDIYAIGITLYEMLTGRNPFATGRETPADYMRVIDAVLNEAPPDPRRARPELSDGMVALLRAVTAKAKGVRPASCAELRRMLDAAAGSEDPSVPAPSGAVLEEVAPTEATVAGVAPAGAWSAWETELRSHLGTRPGRRQAIAILALLVLGVAALAAALSGGGSDDSDVARALLPEDPGTVAASLAGRYERYVAEDQPDSLLSLYGPGPVDYFGRRHLAANELRPALVSRIERVGSRGLDVRVMAATWLGDTAIDARWMAMRPGGDSAEERLLLKPSDGAWLIASHAGQELPPDADGSTAGTSARHTSAARVSSRREPARVAPPPGPRELVFEPRAPKGKKWKGEPKEGGKGHGKGRHGGD